MFHIFHLHSHITFLVAKKYIQDKDINLENCVFVYFRGYCPPVEFNFLCNKCLSFPQDILSDGFSRLFQGFNITASIRNLHSIDAFINEKVGNDSFYYYLPNAVTADFSSAVISSRQCLGYYFLEEGSGSYLPDNILPEFATGLGKKLFYHCFLNIFFHRFYCVRRTCFFHKNHKYSGTISTSNDCFPDMPGERIVINDIFSDAGVTYTPDVILSIDGSLPTFFELDSIRALFANLKTILKGKTIAFKFHPLFYNRPELTKSYRTIISSAFGDTAYELPNDCILENVLFANQRIEFYSDYSSIAIYASRFGVKCYSYCNLLYPFDKNNLYRAHVEKCPAVITNSYKPITNELISGIDTKSNS